MKKFTLDKLNAKGGCFLQPEERSKIGKCDMSIGRVTKCLASMLEGKEDCVVVLKNFEQETLAIYKSALENLGIGYEAGKAWTNEYDLGLANFLLLEKKINHFFAVFNYCLENCIGTKTFDNIMSKNNVGCCGSNYYTDKSSFADIQNGILDQRRILKYGLPIGKQYFEDEGVYVTLRVCDYHSEDKGCILSSHKSILCISHLCKQGIVFLKTEYGIDYHLLGINKTLTYALMGSLGENELSYFIKRIDSAISVIIEKNRSQQKAVINNTRN